jgi:hypothetical protein
MDIGRSRQSQFDIGAYGVKPLALPVRRRKAGSTRANRHAHVLGVNGDVDTRNRTVIDKI